MRLAIKKIQGDGVQTRQFVSVRCAAMVMGGVSVLARAGFGFRCGGISQKDFGWFAGEGARASVDLRNG
jgi:hypothetical protein